MLLVSFFSLIKSSIQELSYTVEVAMYRKCDMSRRSYTLFQSPHMEISAWYLAAIGCIFNPTDISDHKRKIYNC